MAAAGYDYFRQQKRLLEENASVLFKECDLVNNAGAPIAMTKKTREETSLDNNIVLKLDKKTGLFPFTLLISRTLEWTVGIFLGYGGTITYKDRKDKSKLQAAIENERPKS